MRKLEYWKRLLYTVCMFGLFSNMAAHSLAPAGPAWAGNLCMAAATSTTAWIYDFPEQRRKKWLRGVWALALVGVNILFWGYYLGR